MHETERVEFFQSESSFGSESNLNNSRYNDFTNDILFETDNIFLSLKQQLFPNENLLQLDKLKYTLSRAQLIQKDTIPEHEAYLSKIEASKNVREQIETCKDKLTKLLTDYHNFKEGNFPYKDFYNKYGKEFGYKQGNFHKIKDLHIESNDDFQPSLKPEYIQINYNHERQKLRATPRVFMASTVPASDKEVTSLREEIHQLKRTMEENKKNYEQQLRNQKLNSERRLRTYLQMHSAGDPQINQMKEQLKHYSEQISKSIEHNQHLQLSLAEQKKIIETLKTDNTSLQEQIQIRRRTDSNAMEDDRSNRSYMSEVGDKDEKKLEKKVKNLQQQNQLLKNQLKTERQRLYTIKTDLTEQERRELERNRKQLNKKNEELSELYAKFDRQRVQFMQLSQTAKSHSLRNQHLNNQNQTLNQYIEKINTADLKPQIVTKSADQSLSVSRNVNKCRVEEYEGDGIEGYAYYELLNKQFRIRFKRACLKQKQLLCKSNGVEIGVITNFQPTNTLTFLVHLTNYSDRTLQKIRVKIMNPNGNKISGDIFEYAELPSNEQVKIPVSLHINFYPLGPLTLLLEYNLDKKEEVRILLPSHIFKTVVAEERENNKLTNPTRISLVPQRKICKEFSDIKNYFKGIKGSNETMNLSLYHRQTHTLLHLNIEQTREGLALLYEHIEGNNFITEYFIKTFAFLLRK